MIDLFPVPLLFPLAVPLGPIVLGLSIGRLVTMEGWRPLYQHECGHVTDFYLYTEDMCPKCGEYGKWTKRKGRDVFPWGYEFAKENA